MRFVIEEIHRDVLGAIAPGAREIHGFLVRSLDVKASTRPEETRRFSYQSRWVLEVLDDVHAGYAIEARVWPGKLIDVKIRSSKIGSWRIALRISRDVRR